MSGRLDRNTQQISCPKCKFVFMAVSRRV
jgi:hypothetical protein